MGSVIVVFVISLMGFFLAHLVFFFTLNKKNRPILNTINFSALIVYSFALGVIFLEQKHALLETTDQNFLLIGGALLLFFVIKDYYSRAKSQGVLYAVLIMVLAYMGLVNVYFKPEIKTIGFNPDKLFLINLQVLLDQIAVVIFILAILYSVSYHYALREIKSHQPFFFSNRFLSFQRLKFWIDVFLILGCMGEGLSLWLGFEIIEFSSSIETTDSRSWSMLQFQFINVVILFYFLILIYVRYRNWFSSKLNLYWMLLSLGLFIAKVVYW